MVGNFSQPPIFLFIFVMFKMQNYGNRKIQTKG